MDAPEMDALEIDGPEMDAPEIERNMPSRGSLERRPISAAGHCVASDRASDPFATIIDSGARLEPVVTGEEGEGASPVARSPLHASGSVPVKVGESETG